MINRFKASRTRNNLNIRPQILSPSDADADHPEDGGPGRNAVCETHKPVSGTPSVSILWLARVKTNSGINLVGGISGTLPTYRLLLPAVPINHSLAVYAKSFVFRLGGHI